MTASSSGKNIGCYLRYQRTKRKLSLREFAALSSLTPAYLSRLESGAYQTVTTAVIEKLANGFQIPIMEFMKKCKVAHAPPTLLPDFGFYLREKYQLPTRAVEDMIVFLEFIRKRYKKEITSFQTKHKAYWKKRA